MAPVTFLEAIKQAMFEEMQRDPSVVLIGEDVVAIPICNSSSGRSAVPVPG